MKKIRSFISKIKLDVWGNLRKEEGWDFERKIEIQGMMEMFKFMILEKQIERFMGKRELEKKEVKVILEMWKQNIEEKIENEVKRVMKVKRKGILKVRVIEEDYLE